MFIFLGGAPDKVEEADEIASLEENLENNVDRVVVLSSDDPTGVYISY